jgi:predicted lysophospholipase L1 biosynthesis ABC-type transport system permease subunit
MLKDKMVIWILEYIVGGMLVITSLAVLGFRRSTWADAHIWAAHLFVICLGVVLISCASSMRQRILLARRVDRLAKQLADGSLTSQAAATESNS